MKKKIFDCFLYDGEKELLKLRLLYNNPFVYKFILVQSKISFKGSIKEKDPILLEEIISWEQNLASKVKIINLNYKDFLNATRPHEREIISRGAFVKGLNSANKNDLILISDVDEIIDCKKLLELNLNQKIIYRLNIYFTYFSFNNLCISSPWWGAPIVFDFSIYKERNLNLSRIRQVGEFKSLIPKNIKEKKLYYFGIHLSFLGGYKAALTKLQNYSDSPINLSKFTKEYYMMKILSGGDIFERKLIWKIVNKENFLLDKKLLEMIDKPPFFDKNFNFKFSQNNPFLKIYLKLLTFSVNIFYRKILFIFFILFFKKSYSQKNNF